MNNFKHEYEELTLTNSSSISKVDWDNHTIIDTQQLLLMSTLMKPNQNPNHYVAVANHNNNNNSNHFNTTTTDTTTSYSNRMKSPGSPSTILAAAVQQQQQQQQCGNVVPPLPPPSPPKLLTPTISNEYTTTSNSRNTPSITTHITTTNNNNNNNMMEPIPLHDSASFDYGNALNFLTSMQYQKQDSNLNDNHRDHPRCVTFMNNNNNNNTNGSQQQTPPPTLHSQKQGDGDGHNIDHNYRIIGSGACIGTIQDSNIMPNVLVVQHTHHHHQEQQQPFQSNKRKAQDNTTTENNHHHQQQQQQQQHDDSQHHSRCTRKYSQQQGTQQQQQVPNHLPLDEQLSSNCRPKVVVVPHANNSSCMRSSSTTNNNNIISTMTIPPRRNARGTTLSLSISSISSTGKDMTPSATTTITASALLHNTCKLFPTSLSVIESAIQLDPDAVHTPIPTICTNQYKLHSPGTPVLQHDLNKQNSSSNVTTNTSAAENSSFFSTRSNNNHHRNTNTSIIRNIYCYPLNIALIHNATMDVLYYLIKLYRNVVCQLDGPNQTGSLSIALASIPSVSKASESSSLSKTSTTHSNEDAVKGTTTNGEDEIMTTKTKTATTNGNNNGTNIATTRMDQLVRMLVHANPACVKVLDRRHNTALHYLAKRQHNDISCSTISLVYQLYPEATQIRNYFGQTPVQVAQRNPYLSDTILNYWYACSYRLPEMKLEQSLIVIDHELDESSDHKEDYGPIHDKSWRGCGGGTCGSSSNGQKNTTNNTVATLSSSTSSTTITAAKAANTAAYFVPSVLKSSTVEYETRR